MARIPQFRFHVAVTSGMPIYRQLVDQVRAQIHSGRLAAGDFLPSVRQVARQLTVNAMTVSKAYTLLERDGVLENVRGQGMRVAAATEKPSAAKLAKLNALLRQAATRAQAVGLSPDETGALLYSAFKEIDHERVGGDRTD